MIRKMLQMQERMFKSFFDSIVINVNISFDFLIYLLVELKLRIVEEEIGYLKNSFEFLEKDIYDLKFVLFKL